MKLSDEYFKAKTKEVYNGLDYAFDMDTEEAIEKVLRSVARDQEASQVVCRLYAIQRVETAMDYLKDEVAKAEDSFILTANNFLKLALANLNGSEE